MTFVSSIRKPHRARVFDVRAAEAELLSGWLPWDQLQWDRRHLKNTGGECWPWIAVMRDGYGMMKWRGHCMNTHRVACIRAHGMPPADNSFACHRCGNRACVNPQHLYWGTPASNNEDARRLAEVTWGADRYNAKLDDSLVRRIRYGDLKDVPIVQVSRLLGISRASIYSAKAGRTWAHIVDQV